MLLHPAEAAAAVVEQVRQAERLHQRDGDRQVAGPLRDLALTDRALLLPLLELRDHHREDLHDDRAGDVRHDPEREHGELRERAAGEELEEAEHAALLGLLLQLLDADRGRCPAPGRATRTGRGPASGGEQDLVPEVRNLEHVLEAREHGGAPFGPVAVGETLRDVQRLVCALPLAGGRPWPNGGGRTSTLPPAAVMALSADFEKAWARTVTLRVSSPRPSTLISAPLWARPVAWSVSGVTSSSPQPSTVSRLMAWYSTRNGFLKPLELRHPHVQRHLAALEVHLDACPERPGPWCRGRRSCRPCRRCRDRPGCRAGSTPARLQIVDLHRCDLFDLHEMRDLGDHARGSRAGRAACSSCRCGRGRGRAACPAASASSRWPTASA